MKFQTLIVKKGKDIGFVFPPEVIKEMNLNEVDKVVIEDITPLVKERKK